MSKLVLVNYRVSDAEEREARRKIALIRSMLERCAKLQAELAKLEPVAGENWQDTLTRYRKLVDANRWQDFLGDYNRLYDELPAVERRLEKDLADARGKRLRLELTAATLLASAQTPAERKQLDGIAKSASTLHGDRFGQVHAELERMVRQRLETPLRAQQRAMSDDQIALARDLLASTPSEAGHPQGFGEDRQATYDAGSTPRASSDRVLRLTEQLSQLDSALTSVGDLIARLRDLPMRDPERQALLIDSIEIEAKERLEAGRRRHDLEAVVDDGLAWLTPFQSAAADSHREALKKALAAADLDAARQAARQAQVWAEAEGKRLDGERVRGVLLDELKDLGYEVNVQGSGWSEGSRIAIQRPSEPNYDVQLSAAPDGAIQSKVRAYDNAGRSAGINRRDVEVEQSWCEDLKRLNTKLAQRGIVGRIDHEDLPGSAAQLPLPARSRPAEPYTTPRELQRKG